MSNKKVIDNIYEKQEIDNFEKQVDDFLLKVFNIQSALVTDSSQLSDFSFSGLTREQHDVLMSLEQNKIVSYWDCVILSKINNLYGITIDTMVYPLIDVIKSIEDKKIKPRLH